MKNILVLLAVAAPIALAAACSSSSGGGNNGSSGSSSGTGTSSGSASGSSSGSGSASGTGNPFIFDASFDINIDALIAEAVACKSTADCATGVEGGPGICCVAPGFSGGAVMVSVCEEGPMCPSSGLLGSIQLCASDADCTAPGMTSCNTLSFLGFTSMTCGAPPSEGGTTTTPEDGGSGDAAPSDGATGG
jgi:hypothetical protein